MVSAEAAAAWWQDELAAADGPVRAVVEPVLQRLRAAFTRGRFPQSLLLTGPPGLGREWVATETAAMLCCPDGRVGCTCASCHRVRAGNHPDVQLLRPEGKGRQIKIDPVRQVVTAAAGRPYEAPRRVWILDGVERGSFGTEAANAFLKVLEEPPDHVCFILLAGNPTAVLSTILSRCQRLPLPGPVAVVAALGGEGGGGELATLRSQGVAVDELQDAVKRAMQQLAEGEVRQALELCHRIADEPAAFQLLAATALESAALDDGHPGASELVELAAAALAAESRCRTLNLDRRRQLLSCLLRWSSPAAAG